MSAIAWGIKLSNSRKDSRTASLNHWDRVPSGLVAAISKTKLGEPQSQREKRRLYNEQEAQSIPNEIKLLQE